jgi:hypothetical protein
LNDTPARQVYRDLKTAFAVALEVWEGLPLEPSPEALQATAATAFIALSRQQSSPPAGRATPAATGRPAPSPAADTGPVPACPACGGEMWDNRKGKKNPKGPDFRCKDKECLDEKGFVTSSWVEKEGQKKGGKSSPARVLAAASAAKGSAQNFEERPKPLDDDGDDLPF